MPQTMVTGIYGKGKNQLPERMRYLHPEAGKSYLKHLAETAVASDMFRSAEASLRARRERRGAQRPAYSGHNFGFSIDLAVSKTMKKGKFKSKRLLDEWMMKAGWYCHRRDHRREFEEWHYNYFGDEFDKYVKPKDKRTSAALERKIVDYYGRWWSQMDASDAQRALRRLGLYDGDIDGSFGPLSKEAARVFQRAWLLDPKGTLDLRTKRTLAYVSADRNLLNA
jgi:hypothetical protein